MPGQGWLQTGAATAISVFWLYLEYQQKQEQLAVLSSCICQAPAAHMLGEAGCTMRQG